MSPLQRLLRVPTRRPRSTLVALAVVAAAAGAVVSRGVPTAFGVERLVAAGDPAFVRWRALGERWGRDDCVAFVFAVRDAPGAGWFTPDGGRAALALARDLAASPLVVELDGPTTTSIVRDEGGTLHVGPALTRARVDALGPDGLAALGRWLAAEPATRGRLVSADGRALVFALRVAPPADGLAGAREHAAVAAHVEQALAPHRAPGTTFLVTGGPTTQDAYRRFVQQDARRFVGLVGLLLAAALAATFRSVAGVLLPLGSVLLALLLTGAAMALLGIPANLLGSAIPVLVLVAGVSDSVHLLQRRAEELAAGRSAADALERAVEVTAHACLLTSVTTASGFFALLATGVPMLRELGLAIGLGVLLAYVVSLALVPAACALWPPPVRREPAASERLRRLAERVTARPVAAAGAVVAAVALLLALGGPRLRVESRVVDDLPEDHPIVRTRAEVDALVGGNYPMMLLVHPTAPVERPEEEPDLVARLASFQRALAQGDDGFLGGTLSVADLAALAWRELGGASPLPPTREGLAQTLVLLEAQVEQYVERGDRPALRVALRVRDRGTRATDAFLARARAAFVRTFGDAATLEEQGFVLLAQRTHRGIVEDALTSFGLDLVVVALLLGPLFRSPRLVLLALLPNLVPLAATLGVMGLLGIELKIASSIVFTIVFGIAVDDTVHVLARYHEERRAGLAPREAALRTVATSGRALLLMALVLTCGFAALLLSAFAPSRVLGLLMAVTVGAGVVADLVLLPALLVLGDREA